MQTIIEIMAKRAFLIHGWGGYPEEGWIPWLKKELETRGFTVYVPAMPDTNHPRMGGWVEHLAKLVGKADEGCYFIGHSLGCITILRYLETLKERVGGAVFIAGFASGLGSGYEEIDNFFANQIDWKKIKGNCKKFVVIHSDDDNTVAVKYAYDLREELDAELILQHGMNHYSGDDGMTELPAALESVLKMAGKAKP